MKKNRVRQIDGSRKSTVKKVVKDYYYHEANVLILMNGDVHALSLSFSSHAPAKHPPIFFLSLCYVLVPLETSLLLVLRFPSIPKTVPSR